MTARHPFSCFATALALAFAAIPTAAATETPTPEHLEPPRLVRFIEAIYPSDSAVADPVEVELDLVISAEGQVTSATASTPSGTPFEAAAIEAARQFVFEPARRDGREIPARIRYRYVFAPPKPPAPVTGVLEGRVVARDNQPLADANIVVTAEDGSVARSEASTADGSFRFDELLPGRYRVEIAHPRARSFSGTEEVTAGEATSLTVRLEPPASPDERLLEGQPLEFGATATVEAPPREVTKRTLVAEELNRVAGTRGDALRAVEFMPGVARPPVGQGLVIIRGSAPSDSSVMMEGATVPRLYHFGGLTSFVQGRLLDRIDMVPGNFSARYGRKLGGIVDASLRDPKSDRWRAMFDVNLIDASALVEGPVSSTVSVAAAVRRSHLDAWIGPLVESADLDINAAPVYYDYQLMASWRPREADRLRFFVLGSTDNLQVMLKKSVDSDTAVRGNLGMSSAFHRAQGQWLHRFGERVEQDINLTVGPMLDKQQVGPDLSLNLTMLEITARAEWRIRLGERLRLLAGIDHYSAWGDARYTGPRLASFEGDPSMGGSLAGRTVRSLDFTGWINRPAAYAELAAQLTGAWQMVGGVRADYYDEIDEATVDPRLVTRYELRTGTTFKGGAGMFSQGPEIPQTMREIGNPNLNPAHGQHYSLGVEQKLGSAVFSVEGFHKRLDNLVVSSEVAGEPIQNGGIGRIWGAELSLKANLGERGFAFVSYTFSRSRRNDHGKSWRRFDYDQPHILNASVTYRLGWGFELGGTFRYISGNPETPIEGQTYNANTDLYVPTYGATNSARNPAFQQLDLRLEKTWTRGWGKVAAYLDLQNATNHRNTEGRMYNYDYTKNKTTAGLPVIPSVGLRCEL